MSQSEFKQNPNGVNDHLWYPPVEKGVYICARCGYSVPSHNLLRGPIIGIPKCQTIK